MNWKKVILKVLKLKPHEDLIVRKDILPHPKVAGFRETLGEPQGQLADYELVLDDGRRIHVREYEKYYRVHWDYVSPSIDPIGHLIYDAPHWFLAALFTVGAAFGYAKTGRFEKALGTGLAFGVVGAILLAAFNYSASASEA
jgi:hypothetical protein